MNDDQKRTVERVAREHGVWHDAPDGSLFPASTSEALARQAADAAKMNIKTAAVKAVLEAAGDTVDWKPNR